MQIIVLIALWMYGKRVGRETADVAKPRAFLLLVWGPNLYLAKLRLILPAKHSPTSLVSLMKNRQA